MKVARIEEDTLTEEEKKIVDRIGIENLDYCVAAIAQDRHPDKEITYLEDENAFEINSEESPVDRFDLDFEITSSDPDYETVCRHVQTLELLFDVSSRNT
jgi:hypothetical protein